MMTETLPEARLEVFPVAIGIYLHHNDLYVGPEVKEVARVLAEYGGEVVLWGDWMQKRGEQAVQERMDLWAQSTTGNTFFYWAGHGWSTDDRAVLLHSDSPKSPTDEQGIVPAQLAEWIYQRERHNLDAGTWSVVVIDTCRSAQFVELLNAELDKLQGSRRLLLVGVSGAGTTNLGVFSRALRAALRDTFAAEPYVDLWELGKELMARLPSHNPPIPRHVHQLVMRRWMPLPAQATLDMAQTLHAALLRLSDDERHHYVPKAQGGELRELAWYFEGRSRERQVIAGWFRTAANGMLIVTGRAGSGKSALLGNLLVHSRPELRQAMIDAELIEPLPEDEQPPDDVFSGAVYLTGLAAADLLSRIADDLALPAPDLGARLAEQVDALIAGIRGRAALATILIDALDEADDPTAVAQAVLRPLSMLPNVRLLVGTRQSAFESPGDEESPDRDLLDALDARPGQTVTVGHDRGAIRRYILRRLADSTDVRQRAPAAVIEDVAATLGEAARDFLFARLAVHEILADPGIVLPDRIDDLDELTRTTHRSLFARAVRRLRRRSRVNYWLLTALAYAQGRGLPLRDGVWASVANALSDDTETASNTDISTLLEHASPYLAIDLDHGQTVYRLAHCTFVEHFTDLSQDQRRHRVITQRLIALGEEQLNPYLVHHLPAHAGAGGQSAWQGLAAHPGILDELSPAAVTGAVMRTAFGRFALPHPIAGIVAAAHLLTSAPTEDRTLLRQLSAARHTRSLAASPDDTPVSGQWRLGWAQLTPRPLHAVLTGRATARSPSRDHSDSIRAIAAFDLPRRDGLLVTGQTSGYARMWDPLTGGQAGEEISYQGAISVIVPIQLAPEEGTPERVALAVAADDGIHVWDPAIRVPVTTIASADGRRFQALSPVRWPDGRILLAAGSDDGTIGVWDPVTGTREGHCTRAHEGPVNAITALDPAWPGVLATYGQDGRIRFWEHEAGIWRQSRELTPGPRRPRPGYALAEVQLDPERTLLVSGGHDAMVRLWNPAMQTPVAELRGHRNAVRAIATVRMPGGAPAIATGGDDRTIRLWDPLRHRELGSPFTGHTAQILSITRLSMRDGPALLATSSRDSSVRLWELTGAARTRSARNGAAAATALAEIQTGHHGSVIAVGHEDGSVRLLDIDTGEPVRPSLVGNTVAVRVMSALAISAELNLLAVAGDDRAVKIWNFAGGGGTRLFKVITTSLGSVSALALISGDDGTTFLAVGGKDGAIEFWNVLRGRRIGYEPGAHKEHVLSLTTVRLPRSNLLVASGGHDHTIRFWDLVSGTRADLPPIDNRVPFSAMVLVPGHLGDPLIAVACRDDRIKIRVWNVVTGAVEGRSMSSPPIKAVGAPPGGGGKVTTLTTMRTDIGHDLLIAGNTNHTIGLWDLATGTLLHRLDFGEEITACHASGERLVVASESGVTLLELNRTPDRLAAYDARSPEYAGSADRYGRRDVEGLSAHHSRAKPPPVAKSSSSRCRVALAGVEPLRDEHLDIKFGFQQLKPDRAADARRWLRIALTAFPVGRRPEVTATARRLLRHLGQSAVALGVHARLAIDRPRLGDWERIEQAQRLIHPMCAEIADELRLRDSTLVPGDESGGKGVADAELEDLVLQVLGVLSLNQLHNAIADLAISAYNAASQMVNPNTKPRDVLERLVGDLGTTLPAGGEPAPARKLLLPRSAITSADDVARLFGLPGGTAYFRQALVDPSWCADGYTRVQDNQANSALATLGALVANDLYARTVVEALLSRASTSTGDLRHGVEGAALVSLYGQLGLPDGLLFTAEQPASSPSPEMMANAVQAIFAAAYLSYDCDESRFLRNLPECVQSWLRFSALPVRYGSGS